MLQLGDVCGYANLHSFSSSPGLKQIGNSWNIVLQELVASAEYKFTLRLISTHTKKKLRPSLVPANCNSKQVNVLKLCFCLRNKCY